MDEQTQAQGGELKRLAAKTKFAKDRALSRAENLLLEKVTQRRSGNVLGAE
jgi:hypothetical protein